ncbi:MAG: MFS transporter [Candidatus Obscuribacterales bacterium]|nr:MFS transporter [Candidatus Obscuribacterales bacterium]
MNYITVLKQPKIAALWVSQVLSAFGNQLYMIAAMWMAVQSYGSKAAFVAAAISGGHIAFGILGGVLADRVNRGTIMVASDIVRFVAVATLPIAAMYGPIDFWHFMFVGAMIGIFGALFDPALQASLPLVSESPKSLPAINGLVDITQRLARAISPSLAGFLVALFPLQHFYTIDAVSFLISAAAIFVLSSHIKWNETRIHSTKASHIISDLVEGFNTVKDHKVVAAGLLTTIVMSGLWGIAFTVGIPILVKTRLAGGIGDYGFIVGAYGLGNVLANIIMSNMQIQRKALVMFSGNIMLAIGFFVIAISHSLPLSMIAATFAALGGPMGELITLNLVTSEIDNSHLGKALSFRLLATNGGFSLGLLVAAPLYAHFDPTGIMIVCSVLMAITGVIGISIFGTGKHDAMPQTSSLIKLEDTIARQPAKV